MEVQISKYIHYFQKQGINVLYISQKIVNFAIIIICRNKITKFLIQKHKFLYYLLIGINKLKLL